MVKKIKNKRRKHPDFKANASNTHSVHLLRCAVSVLFALGVVGGLTLWAGTPSQNLIEYNPNLDPLYPKLLERTKPQVVLLGNSMLGFGVNEKLLSEQTGQRTLKLWGSGWSSATWYLAIKNVIVPANPRPQTIVLFFRDHFLTHPTNRVTGEYKRGINQLSGPNEPLLERLAYLNAMNPITYRLNQNSSLFRNRDQYKHKLESKVKSWISSAYGNDDENQFNKTIKYMFGTENLLANELGKAQLKSEAVTKKKLYDFQEMLPVSFLPAIVQTAHDNDIQLILVRVKKRREAEGQSAPAELNNYIHDLKQWCAKQQVPLIDFSDEARLKPEHYADGDHLNPNSGQILFTQLLADRLKPYLTKTSQPTR